MRELPKCSHQMPPCTGSWFPQRTKEVQRTMEVQSSQLCSCLPKCPHSVFKPHYFLTNALTYSKKTGRIEHLMVLQIYLICPLIIGDGLLQNCSEILIRCMHSASHTHSFYSLLFPMDILFRTIKEAWWVHNPHNYYGYHGDPFSPPSLHPMLLMVILTVLYAMITCGPVPVAMRLSL